MAGAQSCACDARIRPIEPPLAVGRSGLITVAADPTGHGHNLRCWLLSRFTPRENSQGTRRLVRGEKRRRVAILRDSHAEFVKHETLCSDLTALDSGKGNAHDRRATTIT